MGQTKHGAARITSPRRTLNALLTNLPYHVTPTVIIGAKFLRWSAYDFSTAT
ncbi:MAG: hypothetical protein KatS3mg055_2388 [Chloroflexus sp.]|nr:MAG: hypothetical protein KatS3mg055_2388 [Chloroflexus sp.]